MKKYRSLLLTILSTLILIMPVGGFAANTVSVHWGGPAGIAYDTGFMQGLKKNPGGGVCLFDMTLVENDSPGGGYSEKGPFSDRIWGQEHARKKLLLKDKRAQNAFLVIFQGRNGMGKHPLVYKVNGHESVLEPWDKDSYHLAYRWIEFPAEWLKQGWNTIELACPEAETSNDGWQLYLSRADEYERGGGDPADAGKTSFKSFNGGRSWKESPFGPDGDTRAEYQIRLSLDRYLPDGYIETPVIDLWKGDDTAFITETAMVRSLKVTASADVPEETIITYSIRKGTDPDPFDPSWSAYERIGSGEQLDSAFDSRFCNTRFVQVRAELSTENPLASPVLRDIAVVAEVTRGTGPVEGLFVTSVVNPVIAYPSVPWEWEKWDRPEFEELRRRENLDRVVKGSRTQFEKITRLFDLAATRIPRKTGGVMPGYPRWDALSILERIEHRGAQGMCPQWNNLLIGYCLACGIQGRLVNGMDHEMGEVWSDDLGKWVYIDVAYYTQFIMDRDTGMPLHLLDLHRRFLDYYYPGRQIDWMGELTSFPRALEIIETRPDPPPVQRSFVPFVDHEAQDYKGFVQASFLRMVPQNNFYEKPDPHPLSSGMLGTWPWDGYINWYDDQTPPMRQYSWHTDRPRDMWPDLNLVHVHTATGHKNNRLFLRFETYTPNYSHFEVCENNGGWTKIDGDRWTWELVPGLNKILVRSVNKLGAEGKPSEFEIIRAVGPVKDIL